MFQLTLKEPHTHTLLLLVCSLHIKVRDVWGSFLDRRWVLLKCLRSGGEAIANCGRDLRAWINDLFTGSWLRAGLVKCATVLSSMAYEWERFRPALDFRCDHPHALCRRSTNATTIIPSGPVAWRACWLV